MVNNMDRYTEQAHKNWAVISPILLKKYKRSATFLNYRNAWELTVAVILSAQTTDDGVNKITPALFEKYPTPRSLADAKPTDVEKILRPVGYYRAKTRYIIGAAKIVTHDWNDVVPSDENLIQQLPGVGRKSAVAIISNVFNRNIGIPVDTHVIRFAKRFGLSRNTNPDKIEQDLLKIIPKKDWKRAGYAIKEYGRKEGRARGYKSMNDPIAMALKSGK